VSTQRDGDTRVQLSLEDTGVGLPPDDTKLFDALYTTKADGMGIGLSVSKSIIEHHRGRLWAAPNSNGPGATFTFSVPSAGPGDQTTGVNATRDQRP
jgi:signal transduction histidine kinase